MKLLHKEIKDCQNCPFCQLVEPRCENWICNAMNKYVDPSKMAYFCPLLDLELRKDES